MGPFSPHPHPNPASIPASDPALRAPVPKVPKVRGSAWGSASHSARPGWARPPARGLCQDTPSSLDWLLSEGHARGDEWAPPSGRLREEFPQPRGSSSCSAVGQPEV